MAIVRTYQCPKCEKCFDFTHHPNDEPPPSFCPLCGADVSGKKKTKRVKKVDSLLSPNRNSWISPSVRRTASKSADAVYRGMERASEERMQDAAEVLGVDARTLSGMKVTDMKDNMRQGDMAQSTSKADAAKLMGDAPIAAGAGAGQQMGFNPDPSSYAGLAAKGPSPYAGNKAREMVTSLHAARGNQIVSRGRINKS